MKVQLEQAELKEPEVIVRGDLSSNEVKNIVGLLSGKTSFRKMFFYKGEREYLFDLKEVAYFEAAKNGAAAHIRGEVFTVPERLRELEAILASKGFVRISKSVIVNAEYVASVESEFSGNYTAYLKNNGGRLTISRKYVKSFKKYILEAY